MTTEGIELGNFIWVYDRAEMVTELLINPNTKEVKIGHLNNYKSNSPMPPDMLFEPEPIIITQDWLNALGLYGLYFPDHIKYIHEAQNYARWVYQVTVKDWNLDLLDEINRKYLNHED